MTKPIPKAIKEHRTNWLWKKIWKRLHQKNKGWGAVFVGEKGSGKTWSALSIAHLLDRNSKKTRFGIGRVCFNALDFLGLIQRDWKKGSFIILDDAGLVLHSKDAMKKEVKRIGKILQSMRYKNMGIILTLPALGMLEKQSRQLLKAYFEVLGIEKNKTRCKYHEMQTNPKSGKIYYHRPRRVEKGTTPTGYPLIHRKTIDSILIDCPPTKLTKEYEKRRKKIMDAFNKQQFEEMKKEREAPSDGRKTASSFESDYKKAKKNLDKYLKPNGKVSKQKLMLNGFTENRAQNLRALLNQERKEEAKNG